MEIGVTAYTKGKIYTSDRNGAKTLGVHPIVIHLAKHYTGSNDRSVIYDWVEKRRGNDIVINVPNKPNASNT